MHTFTPQSVANMLWAFATVDCCPDMTFLQVGGEGVVPAGRLPLSSCS